MSGSPGLPRGGPPAGIDPLAASSAVAGRTIPLPSAPVRPEPLLALSLLVAHAGCGAGGDPLPAADAGDAPGADAAEGCEAPARPPPWLGGYQEEIVARLAGAAEIAPGVTLADRATEARREATRVYLEDELAALGLTPLRHDYGTGVNVYALVPATGSPAARVLLGAHYDTVSGSPGANDNATGVAAALATARLLGEHPCRDTEVVVALFDQEEIGLVGSAAFADLAVAEDWALAAAHTIDQLGWDADGDRVVEIERPSGALGELYQAAAPAAGVTLSQTGTGGTDHVAFRERGIPAVGVTEEFAGGDTTPHYHMPSDTADTVDLDYLAAATGLVMAVFVELVSP